ncbi:hypothetical protein [Micromonospora rhizosphaerae]|uniref:hypothetical protein n=1 Tax=Micromonospora rhizosphaerae TaxID=568872 RepID=UPI00114C856B|nr:hypothetical protein [Micromonospora rhizosphaerae]
MDAAAEPAGPPADAAPGNIKSLGIRFAFYGRMSTWEFQYRLSSGGGSATSPRTFSTAGA